MRQAIAATIAALEAHRLDLDHRTISSLFEGDPGRFDSYSARLDDLLFDYSKHGLDSHALALLLQLARDAGLEQRRTALFAGEKVNLTEKRAVMHMALRNMSGKPVLIDGRDVMPDVLAVRENFLNFAEAIRSGAICGFTGQTFTDVVNIGIGGSDLGPAMAARALSPFRDGGPRTHFVSNVDGADIADTLAPLDLSRTLFII